MFIKDQLEKVAVALAKIRAQRKLEADRNISRSGPEKSQTSVERD